MALTLSNKDGQLVFDLGKGPAPKAYLKITNHTSHKVLFKVRTTQPMWYFVRPNQDIIRPGESIDLIFTLTEHECGRFLRLHRSGTPESVDKHRFLIQSMTIEEDDFISLVNMNPESADRLAEYTRLWEGGNKDDRKLNKLGVVFEYPAGGAAQRIKASDPYEAEDNNDDTQHRGMDSVHSSPLGALPPLQNGEDGHPESYESCWAELQALKKRFDQIREYTVNLTVDRDNIVNKLEALQQEMAAEAAGQGGQGKNAETSRGNQAGAAQPVATKGPSNTYMDAFFILLAALASFVVGRWLSSGK